MFITQKMLLLDLLILQKDVESIAKLIVQSTEFEPASYSAIALENQAQWIHENPIAQKKMIVDLQKNIMDLQSFYQNYHLDLMDAPAEENKTLLTLPVITDLLRQYHVKQTNFVNRYNKIRKRKEEIAVKIAGLNMYNTSQKNEQQKDNSDNFYSILGIISLTNFLTLQNEFGQFHGEILSEGHVNDSQIIFISVSNDQVEELTKLLDHLYFINYGLPPEFFGEGASNIFKLSLEYTVLCDEEEMLEHEIKRLAPNFLYELNRISESLVLLSKLYEVRMSMRQLGHFVLLSGWIAMKEFREFKKKLTEICGQNFELTIVDTDIFKVNVDIPTKLTNPRILKPFETLVTTFGMPNYKELDPTPFFAMLYFLMYGAMFGDVGQGALLFICGILGLMFNKSSFRMIFGLMTWVGISSTIFGFLYGSYFGYESALYPWVPAPLWFSPMHNINTVLMLASMLGIVVISFSYILGIINSILMRDWATLIFSHKGAIAFIVYILVLLMGWMMFQKTPIPLVMIVSFAVLSLFLGLERIWEAIIFGHGSIKDWWMGFFDMFEFFLSMLTNTLSFIRVGAFALTHAALMMAVFTLRDLAGGDTVVANITVLLGNIFVICMEGFIVGIQTLRLEYYEFFMRFFRGTGRIFKPIGYKKNIVN